MAAVNPHIILCQDKNRQGVFFLAAVVFNFSSILHFLLLSAGKGFRFWGQIKRPNCELIVAVT